MQLRADIDESQVLRGLLDEVGARVEAHPELIRARSETEFSLACEKPAKGSPYGEWQWSMLTLGKWLRVRIGNDGFIHELAEIEPHGGSGGWGGSCIPGKALALFCRQWLAETEAQTEQQMELL